MKLRSLFLVALLLLPLAFADTEEQYTFSTNVNLIVENYTVSVNGEGGVTTSLTVSDGTNQTINLPISIVRNITRRDQPLLNDTFFSDVKDLCIRTTDSAMATTLNLSSIFEQSLQYYPLYVDCYINLTETRVNLNEKEGVEKEMNVCSNDLAVKSNKLETCNTMTNELNTNNNECKKDLAKAKSDQILYVIGGAAVVLAFYFWERKKREATTQINRVDRS